MSICKTCGQRTDKKIKSKNQGNYYWGVVVKMISDETGNDSESVHNALKMMLLPRQFVSLGSSGTEVAKSTKELSTSEMEEYLTRCRVFAAETLSLVIPLPNEPHLS